jgi:hypothetical protein
MSLIYNISKNVISFVADIRIYKGGFILFGSSSYKVNGVEMREIISILKPGDILLRRYDHYLGSITIPGYYSHAALYCGDNYIIHMLGKGVTKEDILTFLRCDDITILRHNDEQQIQKAIKTAQEVLEKKVAYDYSFDPDTHKFYCTELIDYCYNFIISSTKEKDHTILPDDLLHVSEFSRLWKSKRAKI